MSVGSVANLDRRRSAPSSSGTWPSGWPASWSSPRSPRPRRRWSACTTDVPLVTVDGDPERPVRGSRSTRPPAPTPPGTCSTPGTARSGTCPAPPDWFDSARRVGAGGQRCATRAPRCRRCSPPTGRPPPATAVGQTLARIRRSPRCSRPTTTSRSASCARCTNAGRRVPEDLSVVGFDDVPEAGYFIPPLTTVRPDFHAVARQAWSCCSPRSRRALITRCGRPSPRPSSPATASLHPGDGSAGTAAGPPHRPGTGTGKPRALIVIYGTASAVNVNVTDDRRFSGPNSAAPVTISSDPGRPRPTPSRRAGPVESGPAPERSSPPGPPRPPSAPGDRRPDPTPAPHPRRGDPTPEERPPMKGSLRAALAAVVLGIATATVLGGGPPASAASADPGHRLRQQPDRPQHVHLRADQRRRPDPPCWSWCTTAAVRPAASSTATATTTSARPTATASSSSLPEATRSGNCFDVSTPAALQTQRRR